MVDVKKLLEELRVFYTKQYEKRMNDSSVTDYISEEDIADEYYPPDVLREHDVSGWVRVEKDYRLGAENALRNFDEKLFRHCKSKELHAHEMIKAIYRARKKQAGNLASGEEVDWGAVGDAGATLVGYRYGVPNRKMIQAAKAFWSYFDEEEAIPWLYLLMGGGWKPKD